MRLTSFTFARKTALLVCVLSAFSGIAYAQKPGAYMWGDSDGNGQIEIPDLSTLGAILGNPAADDATNYQGHPQSRFRQDLDGNGLIEVPDYSILLGWVTGNYSNRPGNPDQLALDETSFSLMPGNSVTLSAYALSPASAGAKIRTGLGVIFKIDPSSTCASAQIYGYSVAGGATVDAWRANAAYHYTLKPGAPDNGRAVVRVNSNGCPSGTVVKVSVYIPNDSEAGVIPGRFPEDLSTDRLVEVAVGDFIPPDTSISSAPDNPSHFTNASFAFSCNENNCNYECKLGSEPWTTCSSPRNYYGLSQGSNTFQVRAIDAAGNLDPSPESYTWTIDDIAPETYLYSHPPDPFVNTVAVFMFSCNDVICSYECSLDSTGWEPCNSLIIYRELLPAVHEFQVRAIDLLGNIDLTPASYTWTIDQTPPDTFIISSPPEQDTNNYAYFSFAANDPACYFECSLDSGAWQTCSSLKQYTALTNGSHTFMVRAIDWAVNIDYSPATYAWTINADPPDTFITSQPQNPSNNTSPAFEFNCSAGPCTFECRLDEGSFIPCDSPMDFTGLTEGFHIFKVRAVDASGNIDPTPANYEWATYNIRPDRITIKIDELSNVTIEYPSSSDHLVLYPGITAERVCDLVGLNASFNADFSELTMEVVNNGTADLNRLWMIDTGARNFGLLNPDAFNKSNQGVTVYGPISPGAGMSRKFQVQIGTLPAYISFDCLEVKDRIVYSSNYGQALRRRNWTMAMDKSDFFQVTNPDNEYLQQTTPSWSPGMEWIAYAQTDYSDPAYQSVIYVAHPDGATPIQVTDSGKYSEQPYFSPTGKQVIYVCQLRTPESSFDICTHGIYGGPETDLIRGDGYYWDGSAYLQYAPAHWLLDKVYQPRYTPDGQYITFLAQEPNSAPSPVAAANRMVLLGMPFDPLTGIAKSAPARVGKVINGDTITSSTKFLGLGECVPSFSADGQYMFCFLREYVKATSWSLNFYGLARISIQDLLANPNSYIGSHVLRIYDIRTFQNQTGALYINFPEYVPELGGVLFSLKWNDYKVDMEMLQLNSSMQPVGAPTVFFSDEKINWTPRIPYRLFPGLYQ